MQRSRVRKQYKATALLISVRGELRFDLGASLVVVGKTTSARRLDGYN